MLTFSLLLSELNEMKNDQLRGIANKQRLEHKALRQKCGQSSIDQKPLSGVDNKENRGVFMHSVRNIPGI